MSRDRAADGSGAGLSAFVHLPSHLNADDYARRYAEGIEPDASPYGFHYGREFGVDVRFSPLPGTRGSAVARVVRQVLGFDLVNSWRNRRAMANADVIWVMREGEALGAVLLMKLGLVPRRPIISSTVWVVNNWATTGAVKRRLYRWLLGDVPRLLVHSERCLPLLAEITSPEQVRLLKFGISTSVFDSAEPVAPAPAPAPAPDGPIRIIAAGNDATRDWKTLIAAFRDVPGVHLTIVCRWLPREDIAGATNIDAPTVAGTAQLAAMYRAADFVAIPMVENLFSGLTVALEAAAIGTPILSSRTGGVTTYFGEDEALYVPPGDPTAMREAVLATTAEQRRAIAGRAHRRFVTEDYSSRAMAGRYAAFTRELLGRAS